MSSSPTEPQAAISGQACLIDGAGRIVWINAAWRAHAASRLWHAAGCVEGKDYLAACRTADPVRFPGVRSIGERLQQLLDGQVDSLELEHRCRIDGTEQQFVMRAQSLSIDHRRCAFVQHEDVTLARRAEQQMRDSEGRYRQLFEAAPDGVFLLGAEGDEVGIILDLNEVAARTHGWARAELRGRSIAELDGAEDAQLVGGRIAQLVRDGQIAFEAVHRRRDGSEFPVEVSARVTVIDGRKFVLSFNRDISERRRADAELQAQSIRLELAARASQVGFWDWDLRSDVVLFSPEWKAQLGYEPDEIADRFDEWQTRCHPDDVQPALDTVQAHLRGEVPFAHTEFRMRHRDGSYRWIYSRGRAVLGEDGKPVRLVGCHVDITEQKRAQIERAAMASRLEQMQRLEAMGTLAGGIAHDFNNILTVIAGNVDLALRETDTDGVVRDALGDVRHAADRAKALVRQILAFSRNDPPERRRFAVRDLLERTQRLLRATVPQAIAIELRVARDTPDVYVDGEQLQQVLLNLGVNSWHAIGDRRGAIVLRARAHTGGGACLEVVDDGDGMDENTARRAFEPFFTTKAGASGTGLGLSVAHGIVTRHGGEIEVETAVGQGSTFRILLPAAPDREATASGVTAQRSTGGRVLLIDDEPALLRVMHRGLEVLGFAVRSFVAPEEALLAYAADPDAFDVVVTDLDMPGCHGIEVARVVRARRRGLPVVLCSGFVKPEVLTDADEVGIARVLNKPFVARELGAVLREVMDAAGG